MNRWLRLRRVDKPPVPSEDDYDELTDRLNRLIAEYRGEGESDDGVDA